MNNCQSCKSWNIIPTHGSTRTDEGMIKLGWRNCTNNKDNLAAFKFYNEKYTCKEWEKK